MIGAASTDMIWAAPVPATILRVPRTNSAPGIRRAIRSGILSVGTSSTGTPRGDRRSPGRRGPRNGRGTHGVVPVPGDRAGDAVLELDERLVAELAAGDRYVGLRVADVALPRRPEDRVGRPPGHLGDRVEELEQAEPCAAGHVARERRPARRERREEVGRDD